VTHPTPTLHFRIKVPGDSRFEGMSASDTSHRVEGLLRLAGPSLTIEWSQTTEVTEVGWSVETRRETRPPELVRLPLTHLAEIELRDRWWRPRLELRATAITALTSIPGAAGGRLVLHLDRRDRATAAELVANVRLALAELALEAAENSQETRELRPGQD
jgi:hypothetical protein